MCGKAQGASNVQVAILLGWFCIVNFGRIGAVDNFAQFQKHGLSVGRVDLSQKFGEFCVGGGVF